MTITRVALVVHDGKPAAVELCRELTAYLRSSGIDVTEEAPELVLALGGDGTVLRAAQLAHAADAPLLGINFGTLGYLTEVDAEHGRTAVETILAGGHHIEERMMLSCEAAGKRFIGLNEVLVERASRHRLVRLVVRIGGESLAAFNADGIIVATPTGSTAYALSAGGPIVSPRAETLVMVPVSAHMLSARPFVLAPDETVEITVDGRGDDASLSLDGGDGCMISSGGIVIVRRHPRRLRLVRLEGPGFLARLRSKLGLPG